jgi:hypothetical protein
MKEPAKVAYFMQDDKPVILLDIHSNMLTNFNQFFWYHFNNHENQKPKEVEMNYIFSLGTFGDREYIKIQFLNIPLQTVEHLAAFINTNIIFYEKD